MMVVASPDVMFPTVEPVVSDLEPIDPDLRAGDASVPILLVLELYVDLVLGVAV